MTDGRRLLAILRHSTKTYVARSVSNTVARSSAMSGATTTPKDDDCLLPKARFAVAEPRSQTGGGVRIVPVALNVLPWQRPPHLGAREQFEGYEFRVKFELPEVRELMLDEPEPIVRNERERPRIGRFNGTVRCVDAACEFERFARRMQQFENFCAKAASGRNGIPVGVRVVAGAELFSAREAPAHAQRMPDSRRLRAPALPVVPRTGTRAPTR